MLNPSELPRIPRDEYKARWDRVQEVLRERQLDMLIAYADDRHTYGTAYARYYGNLPVAFEPVLILFTPGKDPALLVGPETDGYAREVGCFEEICILKEFAAEDEDYPFSRMLPLKQVVSERVPHAVGRIGLAGYSLDEANTIRKSHENPEIITLYDEFLGEPLSEKAHELLHTHYHKVEPLYNFDEV